MGKTAVVLQSFIDDPLVTTLVVLGPKQVVSSSWPDEIEKWDNFSHLTYQVVTGSIQQKRDLFKQNKDVILVNNETLTSKSWADFCEFLARSVKMGGLMLAVDESTCYKNHRSKRFELLKDIVQVFNRVVIMTGTPVPKGLEGLWSQIYLLDQGGLLGHFITHYRNRFMMRHPYVPQKWEPRPGALEEVTEIIKPITLQLTAEDYLCLPDVIYNRRAVPLPPKARKIYDELHKEFLVQLESGDTLDSPNVAANLIRLRQICNGAVYTHGEEAVKSWEEVHSSKIEALQDIITEIDGDPCLLIYQFGHDLERIRKKLGDVPTLSGQGAARLRGLVQSFNRGEIPVLCGHPASMGHGLNLQEGGARHIIWFGTDYNLEYWLQTNRRLIRQGNTAPSIMVHTLEAEYSVEQAIRDTLEQKKQFADTFAERLK